MTGRTRVQGRCPSCGPLTLLPRDMACALPDNATGDALGEFHCPLCDATVFTKMSAQSAKTLLLLGGADVTGSAPLELTEAKTGPALTLDDVFDLHVALEEICCPQVELIGRA